MTRMGRASLGGARAAATAAACAVLAASALAGTAWADTGAGVQDAWSMASDCTACHAVQAASLVAPADDAGAGVDKGASGEKAGAAVSAGEKDAAGAEAGDKRDAVKAVGTEVGAAVGADVVATGKAGAGASPAAVSGEPAAAVADDPDDFSDADGELLGARHGFAACTSCHADEKGLGKVHKRVDASSAAPKRLKKTGVDEGFCLTCHGERSALAALTAEVDVLTDDNGLTVNPHDLPGNVEHGGIGCESCHYMHAGKSAEELAVSLCSSCHHEGVYECFTCHA